VTGLKGPLHVSTASCIGAVFEHGAHVTSWQPKGQSQVIWMSATTLLESSAAIRGGIPICFPWFGSGRDGGQGPSHGFARLTSWTLADVVERDGAVTVTHVLEDSRATRESFPHAFMAVHTVRFGERLDVHLSVENTGDETFSYEAALHTYLRVGDSEQIAIRGLDGASYLDKADRGLKRTQGGDITITGETDRIYFAAGDVEVIDPVLRRTLRVRTSHSANTVVWNPWVERAAALPDFDDDGWRSMVCIEGANLLDDAVTLAPGQVHSMGYQVSAEAFTGPSR
jgi:glucose-6-phosphate 1-epimerase